MYVKSAFSRNEIHSFLKHLFQMKITKSSTSNFGIVYKTNGKKYQNDWMINHLGWLNLANTTIHIK